MNELLLKDIVAETLKLRETYDKEKLLPYLRLVPPEVINNVFNDKAKCGYHLFLASLITVIQPKQVIELGGSLGLSGLCMASALPKDSRLYSITLPRNKELFDWVDPRGYANFTQVLGDDRELESWPIGLDFNETDLWFIDTLHEKEQLEVEWNLYSPFFKTGTIVAFDDIYETSGIREMWKKLASIYESMDLTSECHSTGWGILRIS